MNKAKLISLVLATSVAVSLQASITLQITFGAIYNSSGADVGIGKVGVLVLSTDGNFAGDTAGENADLLNKTIAIGQSWGTGDTVVGIFGATNQVVSGDPKSPGNQFSTNVVVDFNALGIPVAPAGTKLGLYWFPSITDSDLVTAGVQFTPGTNVIGASTSYGFYRSDVIANLGITGINSPAPNTAFVTPSDGSTGKIIARNVDALNATQELQQGVNPGPSVSDYTASLIVVPEPSTYALFAGIVAIGIATYRRRK